MKKLDINTIEQYSSFVTRHGKEVKFVKYIPEAQKESRLIFLLENKVLSCDETGKCWSVNGIHSSYTDSSYSAFDVFVSDKMVGWVNLEKTKNKNILAKCSPVYNSFEEALKNINEKTYKTIKIEWSIE